MERSAGTALQGLPPATASANAHLLRIALAMAFANLFHGGPGPYVQDILLQDVIDRQFPLRVKGISRDRAHGNVPVGFDLEGFEGEGAFGKGSFRELDGKIDILLIGNVRVFLDELRLDDIAITGPECGFGVLQMGDRRTDHQAHAKEPFPLPLFHRSGQLLDVPDHPVMVAVLP
jgi:hypothetical protein